MTGKLLAQTLAERDRLLEENCALAAALEAAQEEAQRRTAEMDALLTAIPDGLVIYDRSRNITRMNRAAAEMLGYSRQEQAASLEERANRLRPLKPDGRRYLVSELPATRAFGGETVLGSIMALQRPDSTIWVSANAAPVTGPDGLPWGVVSTFTDFTRLRETQQQFDETYTELEVTHEELQTQADELAAVNTRLAAERDRLQALLLNIPDEVWFCDTHGNVTAANPAAVRGLSLNESGGSFQPVPDWASLEIYTPEGEPRRPEEAPLLRALRGERVDRQEEIVRNPRTGDLRYRQASASAIRDTFGQVLGAVGIVRDITEQKRGEDALLASREDYRRLAAELEAILSAIPDGLIVYDAEGKILRINDLAMEMLSYREDTWTLPVSERVGSVVQAFHSDGTPCDRDEHVALRALRGEVVRNEDQYIHLPERPEKDFWALFSAGPIPGPEGQPAGAVVTMTNTGQLHAVSDQLRRANLQLQAQADLLHAGAEQLEQRVRERTEDLKALSRRLVELQEHERLAVADQLNNDAGQLLTSLALGLAVLGRYYDGGEEAQAHIRHLQDTADRITATIQNLGAELHPVSLDKLGLAPALRQLVESFGRRMGLEVNTALDLPRGCLEPQAELALYRIAEEALDNVERHAAARHVGLALTCTGGWATLIVEDDGIGFDAEAAIKASSLGLLAMRERTESLGGQFNLESRPGQGTYLVVRVPVGVTD